jgi:hypothetical protein
MLRSRRKKQEGDLTGHVSQNEGIDGTTRIVKMLRRFYIAHHRQKLLVIFLIGFWLLMPVNVPQLDPEIFDGMEQDEPLESKALDPGSDNYRAKRRLSVEAARVWTTGGAR